MKKPSYISTGYFSTNFFEKTIRSKHYDDIYFSPENGEEESELLDELYLHENERFYSRKQFDTRKFIYSYQNIDIKRASTRTGKDQGKIDRFPFIEKKDYDWNLKYNELKEIFEEYNGYPRFNRKSDNRMVTWVNKKTMNRMKFKDGSDIKSWFFKQQSAYKKGTMKENFPERIELLEKLRNWQWLD